MDEWTAVVITHHAWVCGATSTTGCWPLDEDDAPTPTTLVGVAYVHGENERMRQLYSRGGVWADQPYRVTIACRGRDTAGAPVDGHRASGDDAAELAGILN